MKWTITLTFEEIAEIVTAQVEERYGCAVTNTTFNLQSTVANSFASIVGVDVEVVLPDDAPKKKARSR